MTTKWSHLPNAAHVDRIIASLKTHSEQWGLTKNAARDATWYAAWDAETSIEINAAWYAAWVATRDVVWNVARDATWYDTREVACYAAKSSILCLLAYDDCAYMLDSDVGELKILAALGDQKAILMLPACIAFNSIKELESV